MNVCVQPLNRLENISETHGYCMRHNALTLLLCIIYIPIYNIMNTYFIFFVYLYTHIHTQYMILFM